VCLGRAPHAFDLRRSRDVIPSEATGVIVPRT
jgi:hypothetical protein